MGCLYPVLLASGNLVPCGKCPNCLVKRANNWAFRIMHSERKAKYSMWVTLTYDQYHLRITPNGFATLSKRDIQLFFKRLRKRHGKIHTPIKYYVAGEYGSRFQRPHYHVLLLNVKEEHLSKSWIDIDEQTGEVTPIGDVYIDPRPINGAAIAYTCGYMNKPRIVPMHERDDRVKEFSLMSKGLGATYLTDSVKAYHWSDPLHGFVTHPGGSKSALPRYYKLKLFECEQRHNVPASNVDRSKDINNPRCGVCPACLYVAAHQEHANKVILQRFQAAKTDFIQKFGSLDDFNRSQNEARRSAVRNFQKKGSARNDL